MQKTTSYLPDDLAIMVKATAQRTGTSKASVIREAITTYVVTIENLLPDFIGSVSIDGIEGKDTEDW